jgi:hypothetical protein
MDFLRCVCSGRPGALIMPVGGTARIAKTWPFRKRLYRVSKS